MAERQKRSTLPPAERDLSVIDSLEEIVTEPLTQRPASKEYWEQIKDAQSKLRKGLIRNVHEFELVLISRDKVIVSESEEIFTVTESCQGSKTPSHVHSRYVKEVTSQFDLAMADPGWRNGYHTNHLNLFLGLAMESLGCDASKVHHCSPGLGTDLFACTHAASSSFPSYSYSDYFVHHNRPIIFPSPTNPTGGFYTAPSDISRPTSSSYESPMDGFFNPTNSSTTSTDLLSTSSAPVPPTTSRARSESASSVTLCDLCPGRKFTGKPENQKRSLRRHIQTNHSDIPRLTCSRCDAIIGRSDNLKRHMKQHHQQ